MQMMTPFWVCKLGVIENVFELMTTELSRIASRAFEQATLGIPEVGFGKIRGSKPRIAGTMAVPSWTYDEAGPMIISNARTKGMNPLMADGICPFSESDDPGSIGASTISSMTTE